MRDVQSAGSVTTAATPTSAPKNCPLVGATGTSKFLLGLQLQGTTTAGGANTDVAYYMVDAPQGPALLVRDSCTVSLGTVSLALTHQILSDNLDFTSSNPTVGDPPQRVQLHHAHTHEHPDRRDVQPESRIGRSPTWCRRCR